MHQKHWAKVAMAFSALCLIFIALYFASPSLASRFPFLAEPRPLEQEIVASIVIDASKDGYVASPDIPPGSLIVGVARRERITRSTKIEIRYKSTIDVNDTVDVAATFSQQETVVKLAGPLGAEHPDYDATISDSGPLQGTYTISQLDWPIVLHLDGLGLEWLDHDIPIKVGTPLAVSEHWTPRAKTAGEFVLRVRLQDINHAAANRGFVADVVKMTINGVTHDVAGSDDVTMPLSIWTHWIPARWFDLTTYLGAAISALAALLVGVFGAGWGAKLITWFAGRKKHP